MTYDQPRRFLAHPRACHSRITVCIGEINVPGDKYILIIRAPGRQNHHAKHRNLDNGQTDACDLLHDIDSRKSKIKDRK